MDAAAHLPRNHLGYSYYKSILKPVGRFSAEKGERGFASTPVPLPRFEGQENSTFTIKVPRVYLGTKSREEITSRRCVYGTNVYTDDSDVIAACIHQGWFRGAWNKDVDVDLLGLEIDAPAKDTAVNGKDYENDIITDPPPRGPMHVPPKKDLHITVLVLPALEKYASTTRFGIKSREWGGRHDGYKGVHDGLSFMIMSIQWVYGVDGNEGRSSGLRRKFLAEKLDDDTEMANEQVWRPLLVNGNSSNGKQAHAEEGFERGDGGDAMDIDVVENAGDIKGVGMGSWWKKPTVVPKPKDDEIDNGDGEGEGEDEDREIERVTERMVENANANANSGDAAATAEEDDIVKHERISAQATAP